MAPEDKGAIDPRRATFQPVDSVVPGRGHRSRMVYALLKEEILAVTLRPGAVVDENSVAERLSISRTPVRQALDWLAEEGLITSLPGRSTVVAQIDFLNLREFLDAYVLMTRATTRLAAKNCQPEQITSIRAQNESFVAACGTADVREILKLNAKLHSELGRTGGNAYFNSVLEKLLNNERRIMGGSGKERDDLGLERHVQQHNSIINAVARKDVEAADRLAGEHAEATVERLQRLFRHDDPFSVSL